MGADRGASSRARRVARAERQRHSALCGRGAGLARTAAPWRDPPPDFGRWTGAHARFRRWAMAGIWERLFNELSADPDFGYVLVDSTICKAHADATGGRGDSRSRDRSFAWRPDDKDPLGSAPARSWSSSASGMLGSLASEPAAISFDPTMPAQTRNSGQRPRHADGSSSEPSPG